MLCRIKNIKSLFNFLDLKKLKELAEKVEITSSYLSQIETGKRKPTIDTLKAVAKALDIEVDMII